MNREDFEIAGYAYGYGAFSDEEVDNQIKVLECVSSYFKGRGEKMIYLSLQNDLGAFRSIKDSRKNG